MVEGFFPKLAARFEVFGAEPERFIAAGGAVVVLGRYRAKGRDGVVVTRAFARVWTLAEGKIAALDQVADTTALAPACHGSDATATVQP